MTVLLGQLGIWTTFAASAVGVVVLVVALVRDARGKSPDPRLDGRWYVAIALGGALLAVGVMEHALITHDFHIVFVAQNNSRATPLLYSITGLWSALSGSILLWGLALSAMAAMVVWRYRRQSNDSVVMWTTLVIYVVIVFFFGLMVGPANPFVSTHSVSNGLGPNSLLQDNPLVAVHPPLLYLGFVGFTVPFAFTIAMLATGRVGDRWQVETRRWTLVAWTFLSLGLVLGAWWSYQVLGWGGFWGWDPVENAALMPWLCGTAYLHSVLVQERRGLLRVWNMTLSISTFALTILGTFITRSGVIQSVHAFSESSIGPLLIGFFIFVAVTGFGLIAWRGDRLRSPGGIDAPLGREGAFVLNNLVFVGFAFIVLLGTLFPLLYQALKNQQVNVGAPYFDTVAVPVGVAVLLLMGVAPALGWRKIDSKVLVHRLAVPAWIGVLTILVCVVFGIRGLAPLAVFGLGGFAGGSALRSLALSIRASARRGTGAWRGLIGRTNGGMIVHLGIVVLAVGIAASTSFAQRTELALVPGKQVSFDGHTFLFEGIRTVTSPSRQANEALIRVDGRGVFHPAVTQFAGRNSQPVGTPAIDSGVFGDVYLTFDAIGGTGPTSGNQPITPPPNGVGIGVIIEPLIAWIWTGGLIIGFGGLLALLPGKRRKATDPVSGPSPLEIARTKSTKETADAKGSRDLENETGLSDPSDSLVEKESSEVSIGSE